MYPYLLSNMKSWPDSFLTESSTALIPRASLSNTSLTSPPFCMEMTLRPIPLHTSNLEVRITRHKKEMIINQLLSDLLTHSSEREVRSSKVSLEVCKCLLHQVLNINSLLLSDSGGKSKTIDIPSDTDTGGMDWSFLADGSPDFACIHVASVGGIGSNTMVLLDQWIEH